MERTRQKGIIEALLFTVGASVSIKDLSAVLEEDPQALRQVLKEMREEYKSDDRGITLVELEDAWQLSTKQETYDYVRRLVSRPKKRALSEVLLETLSIIAYKQPVTKQEIEAIRGVKCDFAVNKLIEYQLVRELGRLDTVGHPIVFGTTEEFLRSFGVSSIESLPEIDEIRKQTFEDEAQQEIPV